MRLDAAITDFLLARDRAQRTEEWYFDKLSRFKAWCEPQDTDALDPPLIRRFLAGLKDADGHLHRGKMTDQTIHGYARALRAFFYYLRDEGQYPEEWCRWWRKGMPKRAVRVIKTFSDEQVHRMLLACATHPQKAIGERNRALLLFLLDTGVRASELCGLTLDHLHLGRESYATVFGKGRKQRTVGPLGRVCQRQLIRYIEHCRHAECDAVFVNQSGGPLDLNALDAILKGLRDTAGITGVRVSAHTFRHTYAVYYLRQPGASLYKLKILLGHSTMTTTEGYARDFEAREARLGPSVVDGLRTS